jgi:hypothetical protein
VVAYALTTADYFDFATAKELLGSNLEYREGSVYDLRPEVVGTFNVVLFLGAVLPPSVSAACPPPDTCCWRPILWITTC